jgi:hypothetical protein
MLHTFRPNLTLYLKEITLSQMKNPNAIPSMVKDVAWVLSMFGVTAWV